MIKIKQSHLIPEAAKVAIACHLLISSSSAEKKMLIKTGSGGNREPVKELVEQFPLMSVLAFGDGEEDIFEDLTIVPLILI